MVQIDFINVGYGDSVLIQFDPGTDRAFRILTDCGDACVVKTRPESMRISAADFLAEQGIGTLDLLILTHLHFDHAGGLKTIAEKVRIRELWSNYLPPRETWGKQADVRPEFLPGVRGLQKSMNVLMSVLPELDSNGCVIRCVTDPAETRIPGREASLSVSVSGKQTYDQQKAILDKTCRGEPDEAVLHDLDQWINNTSLRLFLQAEGKGILLPGDTYAAHWQQFDIPSCDLLKVPHHGQPDGLNESILGKASPEYVVISVSNDREDNVPSQELIRMVRDHGGKIFFTDAVKGAKYHRSVRFRIEAGRMIPDPDN